MTTPPDRIITTEQMRRWSRTLRGAGWVFVVVTLLLGVFASMQLADAFRSASWPDVPGRVVSATLEGSGTGSSWNYQARVRYAYEVNRAAYSGDRISFAPVGPTSQHAVETVARYATGSDVRVYYDPDEPTTSVLERGASMGGVASVLTAALAFMLFPGAAAAACFWGSRYWRRREAKEQASIGT